MMKMIPTLLYRINNFPIFISDMKSKKHNKITKDYDKQKEKHLEKLADRMLKEDEKLQQLKGKTINPNIFKLF